MIGFPQSFSNLPGRETLARTQVARRTWPFVLDLGIAAIGLACFYAIVRIAMFWAAPSQDQMTVSLSPRALPLYAFYSVVRIALAYGLSLVFAVTYGYMAAYNKRAETFMIAALDIMQSIPVLSFLPPVMLAMISLFPTRHIGVELGAIVLIFTGAVWNMAFSFYTSVKTIPRELMEATTLFRFSRYQRLLQLELPYAAIGLVWNSIMSVAGAWFALMVCEMFHFGTRDFRLPGLGSYLQTAADQGNGHATVYGLLTIVGIIVATDQLIWRPLIIWSDKFKFEQVESAHRISSPILHLLTHSKALTSLFKHTTKPFSESLYLRFAREREARAESMHHASPQLDGKINSDLAGRLLRWCLAIALVLGVAFAALHALTMLRPVQGTQYFALLKGALATFLRINLALALASLWTIPVGVAIGFNPRLARLAQPLVQIAASIPAPAYFPVILLALIKLGQGIGIGSIALMLFGTQWYILFNVIAGAMAIPTDLKEVASLFRFSQLERWKTVILPGIFPFLITGLITASGGAWNASIIAEYFPLNNHILKTVGLGAIISSATEQGQFPMLLLGTILISLLVVTTNRLVWRPLYYLASTRYKLE